MLRSVPASEEVLVFGDFNAQVGRPAASQLRGQTDEGFLDENLIVGPYTLHHTNSKGERLELATHLEALQALPMAVEAISHGEPFRNSENAYLLRENLLHEH